jgi:hypothetical protein
MTIIPPQLIRFAKASASTAPRRPPICARPCPGKSPEDGCAEGLVGEDEPPPHAIVITAMTTSASLFICSVTVELFEACRSPLAARRERALTTRPQGAERQEADERAEEDRYGHDADHLYRVSAAPRWTRAPFCTVSRWSLGSETALECEMGDDEEIRNWRERFRRLRGRSLRRKLSYVHAAATLADLRVPAGQSARSAQEFTRWPV